MNPATSLAFATGAFRYGHFTLNLWPALDKCGERTLYNLPSTSVLPGFGRPNPGLSPLAALATAGSLEAIARGLALSHVAPATTGADEGIRDIRIPTGTVDLVVLDIIRARYNQLPNYQALREVYHDGDSNTRRIYGLPGCPRCLKHRRSATDPIACFAAISSNHTTAASLRSLYGKVNRIDAIIGLMAEDPAPGSSFSRTLGNIITDQYYRSRAGDRFFYLNILHKFSASERKLITTSTMGAILRRNLAPGLMMPDNPFLVSSCYKEELAKSCS